MRQGFVSFPQAAPGVQVTAGNEVQPAQAAGVTGPQFISKVSKMRAPVVPYCPQYCHVFVLQGALAMLQDALEPPPDPLQVQVWLPPHDPAL